jgi:hypothetical protein
MQDRANQIALQKNNNFFFYIKRKGQEAYKSLKIKK